MTQPAAFSLSFSAWHTTVGIVALSLLLREPITKIVGKRLDEMVDAVYEAGSNAIVDFPVIALVSGLTYVAHQWAAHTPALLLSTDAEGSLKVAAFVGGVFALKSALTPLLEKVTKCNVIEEVINSSIESADKLRAAEQVPSQILIRNTVILNLFPLALGAAYAYYASVPIKLAQSALYTAALIGIVKLLGKGIESLDKASEIGSTIQHWYFRFNQR